MTINCNPYNQMVGSASESGLNCPYFFGKYEYSEVEPNNASLLKSLGQENPGALYPDCFNWAVDNLNKKVKGFKSSTDENITDFDWRINLENETFRLPLKTLKRICVKTYAGNNKWCRVYSDGYCEQWGYSSTKTTSAAVTVTLLKAMKDADYTPLITPVSNNTTGSYNMGSVSKSDITTTSFKIYAQGSTGATHFWRVNGYIAPEMYESDLGLYFYVGNKIENEGSIDFGKITEALAALGGKINKLGLDFVPIYKQIVAGGTYSNLTEFDLSDVLPDGLVYCYFQAHITLGANDAGRFYITSNLMPLKNYVTNNSNCALQTNNYFSTAGYFVIPINDKKVYIRTQGVTSNCYVSLWGYQVATLGGSND